MDHITDVAIIGAGPVGLFAIFECGMMGLKCHVIDALPEVGGQCIALYPEKPIYDIPAHPKIKAGNLIEKLKAQAAPHNPYYHLNQQVLSVSGTSNNFKIITSENTVIQAKAIIIAAGVGAFGPNRPPIENIESFENKSLFYYVKSPEIFKGKRVIIAGGGDSAVDWALNLVDSAARIIMVHRRHKFRAAPENVGKLEELASRGLIDMEIPYQLDKIEGENGQLNSVTLKGLDATEKTIQADVVLAFFGLSMNLGPIAEWGLNFSKSYITVNPGTCETSQYGIFAIGDIATYPYKQKLILTGFAEAAQAAHAIRALIHPGEIFHFQHSTSQGIPEPTSIISQDTLRTSE